jgi:hypothetical protein
MEKAATVIKWFTNYHGAVPQAMLKKAVSVAILTGNTEPLATMDWSQSEAVWLQDAGVSIPR